MHCGLPISSNEAVTDSPSTAIVAWRRFVGCPIPARNVYRSPSRASSSSGLVPCVGLDGHRRPRLKVLSPRDESRQASQAVPRQLRPAAVGVEELHRRAAIAKRVQQQSVGADAVMAVADRRAPGMRRSARALPPPVRTGNRCRTRAPSRRRTGVHQGTWNALKT